MKSFAFALLLFVAVNVHPSKPDFIPIAEYCVGYEKRIYYNDNDDCFCDTAYVHLHLKKIIQEQPKIATCVRYSLSENRIDSNWTNKFLIHDDLKAEKSGDDNILFGSWGSFMHSSNEMKKFPYISGVTWYFSRNVPIYAKNGKSFDFNKYYEKGKIIPVEWEQKSICGSFYDATFSGTYFIRIMGECDSIPSIESYLKLIKCNGCGEPNDAK
jgi:hypothetical protein